MGEERQKEKPQGETGEEKTSHVPCPGLDPHAHTLTHAREKRGEGTAVCHVPEQRVGGTRNESERDGESERRDGEGVSHPRTRGL
jgi:hypothetical protein